MRAGECPHRHHSTGCPCQGCPVGVRAVWREVWPALRFGAAWGTILGVAVVIAEWWYR